MFHVILVRRSDNIIIAETCDKGMVTAEFEALNKAAALGYKIDDIYQVTEWVDEQEVIIGKVGDIYGIYGDKGEDRSEGSC